MAITRTLDYSCAQELYGDFTHSMGFHSGLLEAGVRRVQLQVNHPFLALLCRSAMHHTKTHTILLESFGKPLLVLQNLAYSLQSYKERKVYVVHVEEAYAEWKVRKCKHFLFDTTVIAGVCALGVGIMVSLVFPTPHIFPHGLLSFYNT